MGTRILFTVVALLCLTPWASPGIALAVGMVLALTLGNPFLVRTRPASKVLLQASVVLLGFSMNLGTVLHAGERGFALAAATIAATFGLGWVAARLFSVPRRVATLISAGTAICGGSAIAAVSVVIAASEAEMAVAMSAVFLLNAVALYLFPHLGWWMGLSQAQFGAWAGMAIHDVSSVVGAAARYGLPALQIATAVKLARALWIVPVSLAVGLTVEKGTPGARRGVRVPWFIVFFVLAAGLRSAVPELAVAAPWFSHLAVAGMTLTLFFIGAGLTRATLRAVGARPLAQALLLWLVVASTSLAAVRMLG